MVDHIAVMLIVRHLTDRKKKQGETLKWQCLTHKAKKEFWNFLEFLYLRNFLKHKERNKVTIGGRMW